MDMVDSNSTITGRLTDFDLPVTRTQALELLEDFVVHHALVWYVSGRHVVRSTVSLSLSIVSRYESEIAFTSRGGGNAVGAS